MFFAFRANKPLHNEAGPRERSDRGRLLPIGQKSTACHGPTLVGRPINFYMMGRGPAWPVKFSENWPRPGPAHHIFRGWAAARPSPSHFQQIPARPGPAHQVFKSLGPARPGQSHASEAHDTRALYGPARQLRGPAHVLSRTKRYMCIG